MKYRFGEMTITGLNCIKTRLLYPGQRLIRFPFYLRGRSGVKFGTNLTTGYGCRIDCADSRDSLEIGNNNSWGDRVHIVALEKVIIGNDCLFASNIFISDCDHGKYQSDCEDIFIHPKDRPLYCKPVIIGQDCWIGENVCILKGSKIGDFCIIGANSVVNSEIPNYSIAVGQPAKVIKKYNLAAKRWENVNLDGGNVATCKTTT